MFVEKTFLLVALLLLFFGCSQPLNPETGIVIITLESSGVPVDGAFVEFINTEEETVSATTSNAAGLSRLVLKNGEYTVNITKDGYEEETFRLVVETSRIITKTTVLKPIENKEYRISLSEALENFASREGTFNYREIDPEFKFVFVEIPPEVSVAFTEWQESIYELSKNNGHEIGLKELAELPSDGRLSCSRGWIEGDVTGDGVVSELDAALTLSVDVGITEVDGLAGVNNDVVDVEKAGCFDMNEDGVVGAVDAAIMLMFARGGDNGHIHHHHVPFLCNEPTITSKNGFGLEWSNPNSWAENRIPRDGDRVKIGPGSEVIYDNSEEVELDCVEIGGRLDFRKDVDTKLKAVNIMILPSGSLIIGTEEEPIQRDRKAEIIILGEEFSEEDTEQWGSGLLGFGSFIVHGAAVEKTFVRVDGNRKEMESGDRIIYLEEPVDWRQGDLVIVPDSRQLKRENYTHPLYSSRDLGWRFSPNDEVVEIVDVSSDGKEIRIKQRNSDAGLLADHKGARNARGELRYSPHVGNLSRNVVIYSDEPDGIRGHTAFMGNAFVDIRYAEFRDLGRTRAADLHPETNHIGRYSLHLHHYFGPKQEPAHGYQFYVKGNSIWNDYEIDAKWGMTIHRSSWGYAGENVFFNIAGSALVTEDGNEWENLIEHNFIVGSKGALPENQTIRDEDGRMGSGIWMHAPYNILRNNVIASSHGAGIIFWNPHFTREEGARRIPLHKGADLHMGQAGVDYLQLPWYVEGQLPALQTLEVKGNEVYSAETGIDIWANAGFLSDATNPFGAEPQLEKHVIEDSVLWHNHAKGIKLWYTHSVLIDGVEIIGDRDYLEHVVPGMGGAGGFGGGDAFRFLDNGRFGYGIDGFHLYYAKALHVKNADIQNMKIGIVPPFERTIIEDSRLENYHNMQIDSFTRELRVNNVDFYELGVNEISEDKKAVVLRNMKPDGDYLALGGLKPWDWPIEIEKYFDNRLIVFEDYSYDGGEEENFRLYFDAQKPGEEVPYWDNADYYNFPGAENGIDNRDTWSMYRVAAGGSLIPEECLNQDNYYDEIKGGVVCRDYEHEIDSTPFVMGARNEIILGVGAEVPETWEVGYVVDYMKPPYGGYRFEREVPIERGVNILIDEPIIDEDTCVEQREPMRRGFYDEDSGCDYFRDAASGEILTKSIVIGVVS